MKKMKVETKKELREQISALYAQIDERDKKENAAKIEERKKLLPKAYDFVRAELNKVCGGRWRNISLDHIEPTMFWFTYELYEGGGKWARLSFRVSDSDIK